MKKFKEFESQVDEEVGDFGILKLPARALLSFLHFSVFTITNSKVINMGVDERMGPAIAMRLNKILPFIELLDAEPYGTDAENALNGFINTDPEQKQFKELLAYMHYSELMPEYHRGYYVVKETTAGFSLQHPSEEFGDYQAKDIMLSELAIPFRTDVPYLPDDEIFKLAETVPEFDVRVFQKALRDKIHRFDKNIHEPKLITDEGLQIITGMNHEEFNSVRATILGLMELCSDIAKVLWLWADGKGHVLGTSNEGLEWLSVNLKTEFLYELISTFSKVGLDKIEILMDYFTIDFSVSPAKHSGGDGFFPPFAKFNEGTIFNPETVMMFMQVRNLIYVHMQLSPDDFHNFISQHMEPTLIEQAINLLPKHGNWIVKTDINYSAGGIVGQLDIVIADTVSNRVAIIETKAPLAPHGARLTARLAGRVEEGLAQLDKFRNLNEALKKDIIIKEFGDVIGNPSFDYALLARSCFGSVNAWKRSSDIKLLTLPLLSGASRANGSEKSLEVYLNSCVNIFDDFFSTTKSDWKIEQIDLCGKEISFPNLVYDDAYVEKRRKELHAEK